MTESTLAFLTQKDKNGNISHILLGHKKTRFGAGKYNGIGGKREENESIVEAMIRETEEEIEVLPVRFSEVGEITFIYKDKPEHNQVTSVFVVSAWSGEPQETEEIRPEWFEVGTIPFESMWQDDKIWLPYLLEEKQFKALFIFENYKIVEHTIQLK